MKLTEKRALHMRVQKMNYITLQLLIITIIYLTTLVFSLQHTFTYSISTDLSDLSHAASTSPLIFFYFLDYSGNS